MLSKVRPKYNEPKSSGASRPAVQPIRLTLRIYRNPITL
jgi:hypothetical protein